MHDHNPFIARRAFWIALVLCLVIFPADAVTPVGFAVCIAYIPVICLGTYCDSETAIPALTTIVAALTLLAPLFKPMGTGGMAASKVNRVLTLMVLALTGVLVHRFRAAQRTLAATDRSALLDETHTKEMLLSAVVESSDDAIFAKALDGTIQSWNRGAQQLFGYTAEEVIGKHIFLLIPEDRRVEEEDIHQTILDGKPIRHFETVRLHKNGKLIDVSVTVSPIKDAVGRIVGASKTIREIGKEKDMATMMHAIIEGVVDGLITIDHKGTVVSFNRSCHRIFGYMEDEVIGQNIKMLMPEPYHHEHDGYLERFQTTREARIIGTSGREVVGRRKDGTVFPMDLAVSEFQFGGNVRYCGLIRDISDRKRAEAEATRYTLALVRSNQALDEFAYAASHDLKAPLRVIANASQWLEEDLAEHLTGENKENMELLRNRVRRMDKLLNDLLAYSRIGRKSEPEYREELTGEALLNDVILLVAPPEGFEVRFDPAFAHISVLRMPLQLIFLNLISNAIKHHHRAQGLVQVGVIPGETFHTFSVKDDGPGIKPQFHDRIFNMFQTLKPRDQVEGSGMGLAMVRKHVEVFSGTISIESEEGAGCIFRFTWPTKQPHLEREAGR